MSSNNYRKIRRLFLVIALVALLVAIIFWLPLKDFRDLSISKISALIQSLKNNPLAPVVYIFFYIVAVVLALPAYILTFLAAPIFGVWWGGLWAVVGTNLGCQITFLISRYLGRDYVQCFIKSGSFGERISRRLESNGFLILFGLRLVAVIPFPVVNYTAGLTLIKHRDYSGATFLGTLPGTFLYVYLAATAANIKKNPWGILIPLIIIILFAIGTVIISQKHKLFRKGQSFVNDDIDASEFD